MDKTTAIRLAGSVQALADLLGVTRPAIYQWKLEVPEMRVYQLKTLRPEWFTGESGFYAFSNSPATKYSA
jgi:hypothetical protein